MKAFFDIDTQLDFVTPGGALYGPGSERLIPAIARLNRYAGEHSIPLISTTDAHPENAKEFRIWPPHCVTGTFGQQKPAATLLTSRAVIPFSPTCSQPRGSMYFLFGLSGPSGLPICDSR